MHTRRRAVPPSCRPLARRSAVPRPEGCLPASSTPTAVNKARLNPDTDRRIAPLRTLLPQGVLRTLHRLVPTAVREKPARLRTGPDPTKEIERTTGKPGRPRQGEAGGPKCRSPHTPAAAQRRPERALPTAPPTRHTRRVRRPRHRRRQKCAHRARRTPPTRTSCRGALLTISNTGRNSMMPAAAVTSVTAPSASMDFSNSAPRPIRRLRTLPPPEQRRDHLRRAGWSLRLCTESRGMRMGDVDKLGGRSRHVATPHGFSAGRPRWPCPGPGRDTPGRTGGREDPVGNDGPLVDVRSTGALSGRRAYSSSRREVRPPANFKPLRTPGVRRQSTPTSGRRIALPAPTVAARHPRSIALQWGRAIVTPRGWDAWSLNSS